MWIERLRISGFGMLSEQEFVFRRDRVNLLIDRNEQGKSTLLHALLSSIYGLHEVKSGRRYGLEEEERCRPWEGETFGVEAVFNLDGDRLEVRRDLAEREVTVLRDGKDVTEEFREGKALVSVGPALTGGLSRDLFLKTFCVTHAGLQAGGFAGLADPVEQALGSHSGHASAKDALATLRRALDTMGDRVVPVRGHKKADRTIHALEERLEELLEEKEGLLLARREREKGWEGRLASDEDPDRIKDEIDRLQFLHDRAAVAEVDRAVRDLHRQEEEIAETGRRLETFQDVLDKSLDAEELAALEACAGREKTAARDAVELRSHREGAQARAAALREEILQRFPGETHPDDRIARLRDAVAVARREDAGRREAERRAEKLVAFLRDQGVAVGEAEARERAFTRVADEHEFMAAPVRHPTPPRYVEDRRDQLRADRRRACLRRSPFLWGGLLLLPVCAATLYGSLNFAIPGPPPVWTGLALAVAVAGLFTATVSCLLRNQKKGKIQAELDKVEGQLAELQRAEEEREERMEAVARRAGLPPERLEEEWRRYLALHHTLEALAQERRRVEEARDSAARLVDGCAVLLKDLLGEAPRDGGLSLLDRGLERSTAWKALADRLATARAEAASLGQREEEASRRAEAARREAAGIMEARGLERPGTGVEESARVYRRALARREEAMRLRDELIPRLRSRLAHLREADPEARRAALEDAARQAIEAHPDWEALEPLMSAADYDAERRRQEAAWRRAREARDRLVLAEAKEEAGLRDRFGPLCEEIETTRRDLARARDFRDCATMALESLEEIARDSHRLWSREINPRVQEIACELLPGLKGFEFTPDLDYRLAVAGKRTLEESDLPALSRGARAQLLLAIRLGLAAYLAAAAPTGTIPLLLDDPFVHFDDDRHLHAMKILLERVLPAHQVFLFSCHEVRYRHLLQFLGTEMEEMVHPVLPVERAEPDALGAVPEAGTGEIGPDYP